MSRVMLVIHSESKAAMIGRMHNVVRNRLHGRSSSSRSWQHVKMRASGAFHVEASRTSRGLPMIHDRRTQVIGAHAISPAEIPNVLNTRTAVPH